MASRWGRDDSNAAAALTVAALMHVAALASAPLLGARVPLAPRSDVGAEQTISIETEPTMEPSRSEKRAVTEPEEPRTTNAGARRELPPAAVARSDAARSDRSHGEADEIAASTASSDASSPSVKEAPRGGDAPRADASNSGPSLPLPGIGAPVWAIPGVLAPLPAPAAAPTTIAAEPPVDPDVAGRVLGGSLAKKDHEKGVDLPAAGTVASAVADAVRGAAAPADSKATFEVRLGADGKLLGVKVVSSDGGTADGWDHAAKTAAASIAAKPMLMTGEAAGRGAIVTVKIDSRRQFASGATKRAQAKPVCADQVLRQLAEQMSDLAGDKGHGPSRDPGVGGRAPAVDTNEVDSKFCIPIGVGVRLDPSDVGSVMKTVVSSQFSVAIPGLKMLDDVKPIDTRAPWSAADPNTVRKRDFIKPKRKKKKDEK